MKFNTIITILICLTLHSTDMMGQQNEIVQAFTSNDFELCLSLSDDLLKIEPENASGLFFKGASLVRLKKYKEGKQALKKAKSNNYQPVAAVDANLLRCYAGLKKTAILKKEIKALAENGFSVTQIFSNQEFAYLDGDKEFLELKNLIDANANPCKYDSNYKKLDFWLGDWEVYVNGTKIANSTISKSKGECTLHENYRTLRNYSGRSMNYFDTSDSLYTQIWVDNFNGILNFKEVAAEDGLLQMMAGKATLTRMTYEYDKAEDTVTQSMENSTDNGSTWNTTFVGIYKRAKDSRQ